ncbi:thiolase family protein [Nocardia sp. SC052]|uniref:thiolase family protein n=1 Tax=Nocardia sichangensis TaxID=3385975 RepID=UPI0039A1F723
MAVQLSDLRPVYVVGVGLHRYQRASDALYPALGVTAIRAALADAGMTWEQVESAYVGTALLGMAAGRPMLRHLGAHGLPITHIENASATGSSAFRSACIEVASGLSDVALAVGVDKPYTVENAATHASERTTAEKAVAPFVHFAILMEEYAARHGSDASDFAYVAAKNLRNGALNPFAHRQRAQSVDEILGSRNIAGALTSLQCCPVSEGAAAVLVASRDGIDRLGLGLNRAIRVAASASRSERWDAGANADAELTALTTSIALAEAGIMPQELDIIELHDAFTVEEPLYLEAIGLVADGQALPAIKEGAFDIDGECAVSPSGGLLAMGHPIGPTGVGQIVEIATQLRGEAGARQHKGARLGLAHMVGLGAVCYVHVLAQD